MSEIISQTIILSLLPVNDRFVSLIMGCLLGNQSDAMSGIGLIHHRPNHHEYEIFHAANIWVPIWSKHFPTDH